MPNLLGSWGLPDDGEAGGGMDLGRDGVAGPILRQGTLVATGAMLPRIVGHLRRPVGGR